VSKPPDSIRPTDPSCGAPILILAQGHAGDRLAAHLAPALQQRFPDRELVGLGGEAMAAEGVRLLGRTEGISAMGYSGVLPQLPRIFATIRNGARATRHNPPAAVVAVDVWQPLRFFHRFGPHLQGVPHVCYLPPGPNFIGPARVHGAVARAFAAIVTPFPHQERLYREAGGNVTMAAHSGLLACRQRCASLPPDRRENVLLLLPGSRELEVRSGLTPQYSAARQISARHPELIPVVGCANEGVARRVRALYPDLRTSLDARELMGRARFALICSGTAVLEAAVLGCPGVVTYHGSRLQRWEWRRYHVPALAELRAKGIASRWVALPNIIAGEELYPECLDAPAESIAAAALRELDRPATQARAALDRVRDQLSWAEPGPVVAELVARAMEATG
jgi:lipid-A-disaccharide synthase